MQFVLQCPDMPRRIVYFVTRLYGYIAVIRKTIELLDYFFTSIVHVRSLRMGSGNKDRIRRLAGRYGLFHRHNCYLSEFGDQVTIGDDKNIKYINIISIRSGVQLSLDPNRLIVLLSTHRSKFMSELIEKGKSLLSNI